MFRQPDIEPTDTPYPKSVAERVSEAKTAHAETATRNDVPYVLSSIEAYQTHPVQPISMGKDGQYHFKANQFVKELVLTHPNTPELYAKHTPGDISQVNQLTGMTVSNWEESVTANREEVNTATVAVAALDTLDTDVVETNHDRFGRGLNERIDYCAEDASCITFVDHKNDFDIPSVWPVLFKLVDTRGGEFILDYSKEMVFEVLWSDRSFLGGCEYSLEENGNLPEFCAGAFCLTIKKNYIEVHRIGDEVPVLSIDIDWTQLLGIEPVNGIYRIRFSDLMSKYYHCLTPNAPIDVELLSFANRSVMEFMSIRSFLLEEGEERGLSKDKLAQVMYGFTQGSEIKQTIHPVKDVGLSAFVKLYQSHVTFDSGEISFEQHGLRYSASIEELEKAIKNHL